MAPPALEYGLTFGPNDDVSLIRWQEHYRLDDEPIADALSQAIEPVFADLLDVAVAAYVTDRACPRRRARARRDGSWWARRIHLRVAVREPDIWRNPAVAEPLTELLAWLTDDCWRLEFVAGPSLRSSETAARLFVDPPAQPTQVGLFSGGLDSLLGAESDLRVPSGELILIGAGTHSRMIGLQRKLASGLAALGPRRLRSVIVPVNLTATGKKRLGDRPESTQRTRGLVFLSLGAAVASAAGVDSVRIYENGPGALNLPLTPGQRGSMNTRAARPETLRLMSQLLVGLTGRSFTFENPDFMSTKSAMCRRARPEAHRLILETVSCDGGLTRRSADDPLCGVCTSCLLRRQALLAAGLDWIDRKDVEKMPGDGLAAPLSHASPMVLAMLSQAGRIDRALYRPDPWAGLVDVFPELASARRALGVEPEPLVELLGCYVDDWRAVPHALVRRFVSRADGLKAEAVV